MKEIDTALGNYIRGQFIVCAIVGIFAYIGYVVIDMPYALHYWQALWRYLISCRTLRSLPGAAPASRYGFNRILLKWSCWWSS